MTDKPIMANDLYAKHVGGKKKLLIDSEQYSGWEMAWRQ